MKTQETANFYRMRTAFFFALVLLLGIGFLYTIRPFFYPVFWAAAIAIFFYPLYHGMNRFIKLPGISSFVTIIIALMTIVLPLTVIGVLLFRQSATLYANFTSGGVDANVEALSRWFEQNPALSPYVQTVRDQWTYYATNATRALSAFLFENIKNITGNSIRFIFLLFITLYTLFYFFRDGEKILSRLRHLSPLQDRHDEILYERFTSTVRATLKGTFIIGGIQGTLGGILFWITGIEGAIIWGAIMFLLSIIPGIGSFIIWLPAGLIMLLIGNTWQGVMILLVGALFISTIDNLLRPPLVGRDIQMHPLLVLFSTLGGIFLFGIPGFIIGPIIAALYLSIMSIYDNYYLHEWKYNE